MKNPIHSLAKSFISESLVGVAVGAGIGLGVSIVLPLMFTQRKSFNLFENPEANECYNNGYYRKTRATNTTASIVGDILGVPATPFLVFLPCLKNIRASASSGVVASSQRLAQRISRSRAFRLLPPDEKGNLQIQ
jgi:hypothetical protein